MKAVLVALSLLPFATSFAQNNTADELRRIQNELRILRQQQDMEASRSAAGNAEIADELRRIRQIEEEKLRDERERRNQQEREEQARKVAEYYAMLQESATALEAQVGQGEPLSVNQLEWIRAVGLDLKAQLESPNTQMIVEMIRETEQGFTGVAGTLPMSKSQANAAKQRIQRDQTLFQRFAAINRANSELVAGSQKESTLSTQEPQVIVPGPVPSNLRPKRSATSEVEARRRALMNQNR